jgi:hypothetical protein
MMSSTTWCTPCPVVLPCRVQSVAWHRAVGSPCTVVMPGKWSTWAALYCSRMFTRLTGINCTVCPYVLQAHDGHDVRRLANMRA